MLSPRRRRLLLLLLWIHLHPHLLLLHHHLVLNLRLHLRVDGLPLPPLVSLLLLPDLVTAQLLLEHLVVRSHVRLRKKTSWKEG